MFENDIRRLICVLLQGFSFERLVHQSAVEFIEISRIERSLLT